LVIKGKYPLICGLLIAMFWNLFPQVVMWDDQITINAPILAEIPYKLKNNELQ
jgi:hypothetical protein